MPTERYLELTHPFIAELTGDGSFADRCLNLVRDRVTKPQDVTELTQFFFRDQLDYSTVSLTWKTQTKGDAKERLMAVRDAISSSSESDALDATNVESTIKSLMTDKGWGNGDTLWPTRVALSGQEKSPGPFELVAAYGKERAIKRLNDAIASL
jgi:glutamyl/glutaminyl-tRNA synthetase